MPPLVQSLAAAAGTVLVGASLLYHAATFAAALRWKRRGRRFEEEAASRLQSLPPVSILKPLCGADPELDLNLESFCTLDYPGYQVIFGALDPNDPALGSARRIRDQHPDLDVVVVEGGETLGENRKVSTLLAMLPNAAHDIIVIADSDMRVEPYYLQAVVAPFGDPNIGLVTCPYRGRDPRSMGGVFEALGIGAEFIPSSFLAYHAFRIRFAFGSTIAIRRNILDRIGGLKPLVDVLADDFALADRTRTIGLEVHLSSYVVDDMLGREAFGSVWRRRVRWARTSRVLQPATYYGLFITFLTPLSVLSVALNPTKVGWWLAGAAILLRIGIAFCIATLATEDRSVRRWAALLPLSEMVSAAIWVVSLCGRTVVWRGKSFEVERDGRLRKV